MSGQKRTGHSLNTLVFDRSSLYKSMFSKFRKEIIALALSVHLQNYLR